MLARPAKPGIDRGKGEPGTLSLFLQQPGSLARSETMQAQTLSLSELPTGSLALFTVELDGSTFGIGTADELRDLIADGIIPLSEPLRFRPTN